MQSSAPNDPVGTIDRVPRTNNYEITAFLFAMLMLSCQVLAVEVDSLEGTVEVRISLDADGKPYYIVRDGEEADRQESP